MANDKKQSGGLWSWIIIGFIVAALAVGILYYIGWFDAQTHVDTPAGDNVEQQYELTENNADSPGEADWQNADHQSLQQVITTPQAETETPPSE